MSVEIPTTEEIPKHDEIVELEGLTKNILEKMLPNIERGDYDLIIGIDASGRIPTLIMDKFIKYVYAQKSYPMPNTRFLAGSASFLGDLEKQIENWNPKKKVLIVEDTIVTGYSVRNLAKVLKEWGVTFDIASMVNFGTLSNLLDSKSVLKAEHIYSGGNDVVDIYAARHLSGVEKVHGKTFSRPFRKGHTGPAIQEIINEARADADIVVKNLIDWYESKQEGEK